MENKLANPAPLGLLGFGMTTVLLNLANAGIMPVTMVILAMGIALGGLAQIIAGVLEFKNGNTFGGTAFTAYGLFWWSLVLILTSSAKYAADSKGLGFYLLLWCVFTLFMAIGTLKHNRASQMVFFSLALLFLLLSLHAFTGIAMIGTIAGIEGIICGLSAIYNALGQVVNGEFGRTVMPLGDKK